MTYVREPHLMIGVSGIRGRVGEGLTAEVVVRYATAFGAWVRAQGGSRTVVLGRDSRVSGPVFHALARAALQAAGCDVMDIGLTTTPTLQLAVEHHHAGGGVCITASHNPIEWNALKFIAPSGLFLSPEDAGALMAIRDAGAPAVGWEALGAVHEDAQAIQRHVDAVLALPLLDLAAIRARRFTVAYDACRGAGGAILLPLFDAMGCRVVAIETEPDGRFPRPPEPVPEQLGALEALVREHRADVGFATDPDVDRLALVSDDGTAPGEDYTLALACRAVLPHRLGPVVTNLSTSRVVDDAAAAFGRPVIHAPVGEVNVALRMRAEGAAIGGEGNGGVILPELHLGRDAPLAAALVLHLLATDGRPLSRILADAPRYTIVKDKLDRTGASLDAVYAALTAAFPDAVLDRQDGLRLTWDDRWMHVRPSNTEPIIRVIAEAPTREAAGALVQRARAELAAAG